MIPVRAGSGRHSQLTLTDADRPCSATPRRVLRLGQRRIPYNPANPIYFGTYMLTTTEGIAYDIDASTGTAAQRDGHRTTIRLTFTDDGVTSSTGFK